MSRPRAPVLNPHHKSSKMFLIYASIDLFCNCHFNKLFSITNHCLQRITNFVMFWEPKLLLQLLGFLSQGDTGELKMIPLSHTLGTRHLKAVLSLRLGDHKLQQIVQRTLLNCQSYLASGCTILLRCNSAESGGGAGTSRDTKQSHLSFQVPPSPGPQSLVK